MLKQVTDKMTTAGTRQENKETREKYLARAPISHSYHLIWVGNSCSGGSDKRVALFDYHQQGRSQPALTTE
jgi:hypothetical protein